jgi:hypothetical protein
MTPAYLSKFGGRRDVKRVKQQRKVGDSMENSMMLHLHKGDLRKGIRGWREVATQRLPTLIMLLDGTINSLPNNVIHISGFGRKDSGVLDFDAMFQINAVFCYRGCLRGICWWCSLNLISIQHPISPV